MTEERFWIAARISGFANRLEIGDPIDAVIKDMRKYAEEISTSATHKDSIWGTVFRLERDKIENSARG